MEKKLKNNKGRVANESAAPPSAKAHMKKLKSEMHKLIVQLSYLKSEMKNIYIAVAY